MSNVRKYLPAIAVVAVVVVVVGFLLLALTAAALWFGWSRSTTDSPISSPLAPPATTGAVPVARSGGRAESRPSVATGPGTRHALLVGVNAYDHPRLSRLSWAENDVRELGELLRSKGYRVRELTGGAQDPTHRATRANVDQAVRDLLKQCRPGDTVLIALAGHGLQFEGEPDAYFCPVDGKPFREESATLVSLSAMYAEMDRSFAGMKVLLVDACRDDPQIGRGVTVDSAPAPPQGVAALFSCSAGQRAYELDTLKHGVFFHYVLEGLRGDARNNDGDVTFNSLADFVARRVEGKMNELSKGSTRQSPNQRANVTGASPVLLALGKLEPAPAPTPAPAPRPTPPRMVPPGDVSIVAGKTVTVKVEVNRHGARGAIAVRVLGLPPGVTAESATIGATKDTVMVKLTAAPSAPSRTKARASIVASIGDDSLEQPLGVTVQRPPPRELVFEDDCDSSSKIKIGTANGGVKSFNSRVQDGSYVATIAAKNFTGPTLHRLPNGDYDCEIRVRTRMGSQCNFTLTLHFDDQTSTTHRMDIVHWVWSSSEQSWGQHLVHYVDKQSKRSTADPLVDLFNLAQLGVNLKDWTVLRVTLRGNRLTWIANNKIIQQKDVKICGRDSKPYSGNMAISVMLDARRSTVSGSIELDYVRIWRLNEP